MHTSPQTATTSLPAPSGRNAHARKTEDLAYQAVTVAAIVVVLGSLWVF